MTIVFTKENSFSFFFKALSRKLLKKYKIKKKFCTHLLDMSTGSKKGYETIIDLTF